jgi:polar amino acid transport system substrate-binding protein
MALFGGAWAAESPIELKLYAWERPPFAYQDERGQAKGLAVELAELLQRHTGVPYHLTFLPLTRAIRETGQRPGNCLLLLERRQEREPHYAWVGPMLISRLSLYAAPGAALSLNSLEDAHGLKILSHLGSGAGEYLQGEGFQVEFSNKESLNLLKLLRRRAPLWASSEAVISSLAETEERRPVEVLPFLTMMEAMACHPQTDPDVIARLQKGLRELYGNGQIQQVYRRYGVELD